MAQLSSRSIERLIDLVEIKLSCIDIMDREDRMEAKLLKRALEELRLCERNAAPRAAVRPVEQVLAH